MRILHKMLIVGDLDKSIKFYVNILGIYWEKKDYPNGKSTLNLLAMVQKKIVQ